MKYYKSTARIVNDLLYATIYSHYCESHKHKVEQEEARHKNSTQYIITFIISIEIGINS